MSIRDRIERETGHSVTVVQKSLMDVVIWLRRWGEDLHGKRSLERIFEEDRHITVMALRMIEATADTIRACGHVLGYPHEQLERDARIMLDVVDSAPNATAGDQQDIYFGKQWSYAHSWGADRPELGPTPDGQPRSVPRMFEAWAERLEQD